LNKEIHVTNHGIKMLCASLALLYAAAGPSIAAPLAEPIYWHMNGSACKPNDETTRDGRYTTGSSGSVAYADTSTTSRLTFICPLTSINDTAAVVRSTPHMRIFYQDPDGGGTAYRVQATMKSYSTPAGTYDSNVCRVTSALAGSWALQATPCALDLSLNTYWVEVVLERMAPGSSLLQFHGVELVGL
jgi:hypothetical protein